MYWREAGRPVSWTKEGKLVYTDAPLRDPLIITLKEMLSQLINHTHIEGFTNRQLYLVCKAMRIREEEITQIKVDL